MKHTLLAVTAGMMSGAMALASMSGASFTVLFLSLLHTLPVFFAGLALGTQPAILAAGMSAAVLSVVSPHLGAVFGVLYALPVWIAIRLLLTGPQGVVRTIPEGEFTGPTEDLGQNLGWYPAGNVLAVLAAIGATYLLGTSMLTGGHLEHNVTEVLKAFAATLAGAQGANVLQDAVERMVPYFPGLLVGMWLVGLVLNMVIAQGLLARGGQNIRPTPKFRELTLPDASSWLLVVAALIALLSSGEMGYVAHNITIALAVPFFLLGLSVVHTLAGRTPLPGAVLGLTYLVVIFSGWMALLIAGMGILEQWVGLRKRMNQPDEH